MLRVHRGCGLLGTNIFLLKGRFEDVFPFLVVGYVTFPETNESPLKIDGWKMTFLFWDTIFSGAMLVSGRVVCWRVYYFWLPPQQATFMTVLRSSVIFVFLDSFFRCDEPRGVEIC